MPKIEVDKELIEILPTFLSNRQKDTVTLKEMLTSKDLAGIKKLGHKVSGSSGGYGFHELGNIAKSLEIAAESGNEQEVSSLIEQFIKYVESIEVEYV